VKVFLRHDLQKVLLSAVTGWVQKRPSYVANGALDKTNKITATPWRRQGPLRPLACRDCTEVERVF